ncbi:MAG: flagellar hook-basal body protein [Phycisphaerales bacterium]
MNYGLYLSASGMLTSLYRMDVLAGNLANSETTGYKSVVATTRQREAAAVEDGLTLPSDQLLEKLGGGVLLMGNRLDLRPGATVETGRSLDVALEGDGFMVVSAESEENPSAVRFTRDGRLGINAESQLVHVSSGRPVLDRSNRAISLAPGREVRIDRDGTVRQGQAIVGRLQVATIADAGALRPAGDGLLGAPAGVMSGRAPTEASVLQGFVERSGVDPVATMVDFAQAERAVSANARLVQLHDQLLDRAINGLGRII